MFVVENWGWPQWAIASIVLLRIGISAALDGEKRARGWFAVDLVSKIIQNAIIVFGGFFQTARWPQLVWVVSAAINLGLSCRLAKRRPAESLLATLVDNSIVVALLTIGGFFA